MRTGVAFAVPLALLAASVGKLADWGRFESSLATFALVPMPVRNVGAVVVPAIEVVPLVLALRGRVLAANAGALALVLVFSGVVGWHWAMNIRPTCSCFGAWTRNAAAEGATEGWLARNGGLIVVGASAIVCSHGRARGGAR